MTSLNTSSSENFFNRKVDNPIKTEHQKKLEEQARQKDNLHVIGQLIGCGVDSKDAFELKGDKLVFKYC